MHAITQKPILGAIVSLDRISIFGSSRHVTHTLRDGTFRFDGVGPGRYRIGVMATGYAEKCFEVRLKKDATHSKQIELQPEIPPALRFAVDSSRTPALILGVVSDSVSGQGISGATVSLGLRRQNAETGSEGEFGFLLPPGDHRLIVTHPDYLTDTIFDVSATARASEIYRFTLCPLRPPIDTVGYIRVIVTDSLGIPVVNASATVMGRLGEEIVLGRSDSMGVWVSAGLGPGLYAVGARRYGLGDGLEGGVEVRANETTEVRLTLKDVTDIDPPDRNHAEGYVFRAGDTIPLEGVRVTLEGGGLSLFTDSAGYFAFTGLARGYHTLSAGAEGYETAVNEDLFFLGDTDTQGVIIILEETRPRGTKPNSVALSGIVVDQKTGLPLSGIVVSIGESVAVTNDRGEYTFPVLDGVAMKRELKADKDGYVRHSAGPSEWHSGIVSVHDIMLRPEEVVDMQRIVVTGRSVQNTREVLLKTRKDAIAVSDGIAADQIGQSSSSSAAEAVRIIPGVTIQDDRYVICRGLNERYNIVRLNGIEMPASHPDRRAVALDIFPAGLLDNLSVTKTFTPDLPAHFAGGIVDITTKSYPEKLSAKLKLKAGYKGGTTFENDFLTTEGGDWDWLGFDDGTRSLPEELEGEDVWVPERYSWLVSPDSADMMLNRTDDVSKAFESTFDPDTTTARPDLGIAASVGNTLSFLGRPLGLYAGFTYNNKMQIVDDLKESLWQLDGHVDERDSLLRKYTFTGNEATLSVLWGLLFNSAYKLTAKNELKLLYLQTRSGKEEAGVKTSEFHEQIDDYQNFVFKEISYLQRRLHFGMLSGEHTIERAGDLQILWRLGYSNSVFEDPDNRVINVIRGIEDTCDGQGSEPCTAPSDTTWLIKRNIGVLPAHRYRSVEDPRFDIQMLITRPFSQWGGLEGFVRAGGHWQHQSRTFKQRLFRIIPGVLLNDLDGDIDAWTADSNMGITCSGSVEERSFCLGNLVTWASLDDSIASHEAWQRVQSAFLMAHVPIAPWLSINGGVRWERIDMRLSNLIDEEGSLGDSYWFPSVGVIFPFVDAMNIRLNYSRTMTRPIFREMALYPSENHALGLIEHGNPDLKSSTIENYDFRWEWFPSPGEVFAAGAFYKMIENPIERVFVLGTDNGETTWENVSQAEILGFELEAEKNLGFLNRHLEGLSIGGNFTRLFTETVYDSTTQAYRKEVFSDPDTKHPMNGASEYILNSHVTYSDDETGFSGGVFFILFGDRLDFIPGDGTPEVYETVGPTLNLSVKKEFDNGLSLSVSCKNILDGRIGRVHEYKGENYFREQYTKGIGGSLSLAYKF